ncbi:hypothetical protein DSD19_02610 [Rhodovulum sp. BSW8]|nr:hypothetical protein DSD19_02610 [Rhodovulum sp. BSW8]
MTVRLLMGKSDAVLIGDGPGQSPVPRPAPLGTALGGQIGRSIDGIGDAEHRTGRQRDLDRAVGMLAGIVDEIGQKDRQTVGRKRQIEPLDIGVVEADGGPRGGRGSADAAHRSDRAVVRPAGLGLGAGQLQEPFHKTPEPVEGQLSFRYGPVGSPSLSAAFAMDEYREALEPAFGFGKG